MGVGEASDEHIRIGVTSYKWRDTHKYSHAYIPAKRLQVNYKNLIRLTGLHAETGSWDERTDKINKRKNELTYEINKRKNE